MWLPRARIAVGDFLRLRLLQGNDVTLADRGTKDQTLWTQLNNWPTKRAGTKRINIYFNNTILTIGRTLWQ